MPRLHVLAVAGNLPSWAKEARDEYLRRMPKGFEVSLEVLKPSLEKKLGEKIPRNSRLVALDERGKDLTTKQFAALLGEPTAFVIGGADGLDPSFVRTVDLTLSFSPLTWPHQLVRIMLAEQLYRTTTILSGHPYHRE